MASGNARPAAPTAADSVRRRGDAMNQDHASSAGTSVSTGQRISRGRMRRTAQHRRSRPAGSRRTRPRPPQRSAWPGQHDVGASTARMSTRGKKLPSSILHLERWKLSAGGCGASTRRPQADPEPGGGRACGRHARRAAPVARRRRSRPVAPHAPGAAPAVPARLSSAPAAPSGRGAGRLLQAAGGARRFRRPALPLQVLDAAARRLGTPPPPQRRGRALARSAAWCSRCQAVKAARKDQPQRQRHRELAQREVRRHAGHRAARAFSSRQRAGAAA